MKKFEIAHRWKTVLFLLVLGSAAFFVGGCATPGGDDDDNGSDLPWNTPQPWEGAPSIPGLDGMNR